MTWISQHKLLFMLIIAVVAVGVWYGLSQGGEPPLLTTTTPEGTLAVAEGDQEIIGTLLALRAVTLSGTIFTEPAFLTLQDFGTTIVPEPVGRENPFAPLNSRSSSATSSANSSNSRGSQIFTPRR